MVQVPWLGETPRSPAIAGIDTLAIDVSSTFMKVARATASDARTRALPSSGGGPLFPGDCAATVYRRSPGVVCDDPLDHLVGLGVDRVECLRLVGGLVAREALQALARALVRVDVDAHREADLQRMRLALLRVEGDAHRDALHHLDPVAGGVLRRQERERASGARAEARDLAVGLDRGAVGVAVPRPRRRSRSPRASPRPYRGARPSRRRRRRPA